MTVTAGRKEKLASCNSMVVQASYLNTPKTNSMANVNYTEYDSTNVPLQNGKLRSFSGSSFSCMDLTEVGKNNHNDHFGKSYYKNNEGVCERKVRSPAVPPRKPNHGLNLKLNDNYGGQNSWVRAGLTLYPLTDVSETRLDSRGESRQGFPRQTQSASEIRHNPWLTGQWNRGPGPHLSAGHVTPISPGVVSHHSLGEIINPSVNPQTYPAMDTYRNNCANHSPNENVHADPEQEKIRKISEYLARSKMYYDQYRAREISLRQEHYSKNMPVNPTNYSHQRVYESKSSSHAPFQRHPSLSRSKSETNLLSDSTNDRTSVDVYSEDEDGDDYGFLSWSSASLSTAMHKARSPLPSRRILPKRWRSKTKAISAVSSSLWSSEGSCTWCSMSGRRVTLKGTSLLHLSEKERLALQKIALAKLQALNLGCQITIPKETTQVKRGRRVLKMLKRKSHSANLTSLLDNLKENQGDKDSKDNKGLGLVFGIPLAKCVANDLELQKRRLSRSEALPLAPHQRKTSNSSVNSIDNTNYNGNLLGVRGTEKNRAVSSESLSESESGKYNSSLLDALSLSLSNQNETPLHLKTSLPQVPQVVKTCFKHLETYGLRTLGIFRVGSTKKRTKQMRDEFDCGKDVKLGDQHNPNDVAALLKEYFRDLPEPLLTRDLYSPLVATRNLYETGKQAEAVRMLISLLPVPNRDTLWALLRFLNKVVEHSTDAYDEHGQLLHGNKMDSHNLATLFGPNILHKAKTGVEKSFVVEDMERAEERSEVIAVIEDMVDYHQDLFSISADLQDQIVRLLMEMDPDIADQLLKKLSSEYGIEPDPDTTSSSVFEDSDSSSLPHSPGVDMEMGLRARTVFEARRNQPRTYHAGLRQVHSVESTGSQGLERLEIPQTTRSESDSIHTDDSQRNVELRSPRSQRSTRMPKLKVSHEKTSGNVRGKPGHVGCGDNYWSDPYSHDLLTVPSLDGRRRSSGSLTSQEPSPVGSDGSGNWMMTTGSSSSGNSSTNSPRIHVPESSRPLTRESVSPRRSRADSSSKSVSSSQQRPLSSRQRPLGVQNSEDSRSESSDLDYDRERWRHWDRSARDYDDSYEQETLV